MMNRMGYIGIILVLIFLIIIPVSAADEDNLKDKDKPVVSEDKLPVTYVPASDDLIGTVLNFIGLGNREYKKDKVSVVFGDRVLGIIKKNSKFHEMPVTKRCIGLQYGTNAWYKCEQLVIERAELNKKAGVK